MDVAGLLVFLCATCQCSVFGVCSEIHVKTVVISDEVASLRGRTFTVQGEPPPNMPAIHLEITWLYVKSPIDFIIIAKNLTKNECDIVILDTVVQVYESTRLFLEQKDITVIHWPIRQLLMYGIPAEFMYKKNNCLYPEDGFICELPSKGKPPKRGSAALTSLLSMSDGKAFVIFENEMDQGINFYTPDLDSVNFKVTLYDIKEETTTDEIESILTEGMDDRKNQDVYTILVCSSPCITKIVQSVNQHDSIANAQTGIEAFSRWIIYSTKQNRELVKSLTSKMDNVVFVSSERRLEQTEQNLFEVFIELSVGVAHQAQNEDNFLEENAVELLSKYFQLFRLSIEKYYGVYTVETLMWFANGRDFATVGQLSPFGDVLHNDIFPNTKNGFNNRKFSVATMLWGPFMRKETVDGIPEYSGFCHDLLDELAVTLNFSYTIEEPADLQWGIKVNGRWTGLVGMLARREVDMVVAALGMDPKRDEVMDFSYPYFYEYISALLAKPDPLKRKWKTYLDPFSTPVFIFVGVSLPVATFVLFIIEKYNPYYSSKSRSKDEGLHVFTDAIWYMYGALLTQGGVHEPSTWSGRTILSFWWLFSIIIVALYSGNLIAFMTVSKQDIPFKTMDDLVEQEEYKWGALNGTLLITLFQNTTTDVYKRVWAGMKKFSQTDPDVLSDNVEVHLAKVRSDKYVYISDLTIFQELMRKHCELMIMDETFFPYHFGVGFQNNSAYLSRVSQRIMELSASGLLTIWKRRWWPNTNPCSADSTSAKKIELLDVQSAFYLIGAGICLATFCLLGELLWFRIRKRRSIRRAETTAGTNSTTPTRH